MQMIPVRIFFEKTGRAKYTSHLDTMRTMTRALKRSGLPVWYTQGFNPHLYSTFPLPIALGYESLCESVDIRLTRPVEMDEVVRRFDGALPPGLRARRAAPPEMDASLIAWGDYEVTLRYLEADPAVMAGKLEALLRQPEIQVTKRTKKGDKLLDIRPLVELLGMEVRGNILALELRLASGNTTNINPTLFLKAFYDWCGLEPDGVRIVRIKILTKELAEFL